MTEQEKRTKLRKYFAKPSGCAMWLLILGILVLLVGLLTLGSGDGTGILLALVGIAATIGGAYWMYSQRAPKAIPSDAEVDAWLEEDIQALVPRALDKSGLTEEDLQQQRPLKVRGPIYWDTTGVNKVDLVYKKGKDGIARFGVYDVTIIFLTDQRLTSYRCDLNFLKNVALNESTTEYFYQDVVSVSTREISTSYTLPNTQKLVSAQAFSVQVPSGDAIKVVVSANKLEEVTGAKLPPTGAEDAVSVIRAMLRSKKGVVRMAQA